MVMLLPAASNGTPDRFVLCRTANGIHVLAGWQGGYLSADEWRFSTPLAKAAVDDDSYLVTTRSGSTYNLPLARYGMTNQTEQVFANFKFSASQDDISFDQLSAAEAWEALINLV